MELLEKIIVAATENTEPLANLLRQCLVLAHVLKNDKLATWAQSELNGYDNNDSLPPYRKIPVIARGFFIGPFQSQIRNQPLTPGVLDPEHQDWARTANLAQPIAAYEGHGTRDGGQIPWPPGLTIKYQTKFYEGYVLNRAWQEIPLSAFASLTDTVPNRILSLALELKDQLGDVSDKPDKLAAEKVDSSVVYHIYGSNNVIASTAQTINQAGRDVVITGDVESLVQTFLQFGIEKADAEEIVRALENDGKKHTPSLGRGTIAAIKKIAGKMVASGGTITTAAATSIITKFVLQYLGLG
jgi:AbiTii